MNIFTAINDYANMTEAAEAAKTQTQLINIGLIIITRSAIFSSNIRKWNGKPEAEKTWPTFKTHFKETQCEIE
jgi:pyruvate/oxaloacetate carboxyltransferase